MELYSSFFFKKLKCNNKNTVYTQSIRRKLSPLIKNQLVKSERKRNHACWQSTSLKWWGLIKCCPRLCELLRGRKSAIIAKIKYPLYQTTEFSFEFSSRQYFSLPMTAAKWRPVNIASPAPNRQLRVISRLARGDPPETRNQTRKLRIGNSLDYCEVIGEIFLNARFNLFVRFLSTFFWRWFFYSSSNRLWFHKLSHIKLFSRCLGIFEQWSDFVEQPLVRAENPGLTSIRCFFEVFCCQTTYHIPIDESCQTTGSLFYESAKKNSKG